MFILILLSFSLALLPSSPSPAFRSSCCFASIASFLSLSLSSMHSLFARSSIVVYTLACSRRGSGCLQPPFQDTLLALFLSLSQSVGSIPALLLSIHRSSGNRSQFRFVPEVQTPAADAASPATGNTMEREREREKVREKTRHETLSCLAATFCLSSLYPLVSHVCERSSFCLCIFIPHVPSCFLPSLQFPHLSSFS